MPGRPAPLDVRIARKIQAEPWTIKDDVWAPFVQAPLVVDGVTFEEIARVRLMFNFSPTGCWIWTGAYSKKRWGKRPVIRLGGRETSMMIVLRLMLCLRDGVPLDERTALHACHGPCDNAACVNPFHAYWGTREANHQDRRTRQPESFLRKSAR